MLVTPYYEKYIKITRDLVEKETCEFQSHSRRSSSNIIRLHMDSRII